MESISLTIVFRQMGRISLKLTTKQRHVLEGIVGRPFGVGRVGSPRAGDPSQCEDVAGREIARPSQSFSGKVFADSDRFRAEGVAGLDERPKAGRKDHAVAAARSSKSYSAMSPPPAGVADGRHGSSRDGWGSPAVACRMYSAPTG